MTGADIITAILLAGIFIAVVVYLLYWLYRRSSKEVAFVRTGLGGEKVVISGGALVLPIVHNVTLVGMNTLRLEVRRSGDKALITKNRMRVEVVAEFNLRVRPDPESVSLAARTLGNRTMEPDRLKDLVQGRFVDALSTVAAQMTMDEMQERRGDYVKAVRALVEDALTRNGLELEAVSLTGLDQIDIELFNPSNAFDAEGLTQLTEQIEKRKKIRNDIEQDTRIQIRAKNLQAEIEALEIDKQSEYARLAQEREVAKQRAQERSDVAKDRASRDQEAQEAEIQAAEAIERARIQKEKAVEAERSLRETTLTEEIETRRKHRNDVERDTEVAIRAKNLEAELRALDIEKEAEFARLRQQQDIVAQRAQQNAEIARQQALGEREAETARIKANEAVEKTRIAQERALDSERILHQQEIELLEIQRRKLLQVEDQERTIAVIRKDMEKAVAQAETEEARARAVEAEEKVVSVREREIAERRKLIELIEAARAVESEALQLTTIAQAQTTAAEQRAAADRFASLAAQLRYEVDAEGRRRLNEAENVRSEQSRHDALRLKLVEHLEGIIRESVKPMEHISDIKILQVEGLPGLSGVHPTAGGGGAGRSDLDGPAPGGPGGGTLADNIVSSALRYRVQAPFVDNLLREIGMSPAEISRLDGLLKNQRADTE
jgi:uncharacterized membrane protein YqiK